MKYLNPVTLTGMNSMMRRHLTASMVVIDPSDPHHPKVLLIDHLASGFKQFPGGHLDPNEAPHEAALREVFEETGVAPRIMFARRPQIDGMTQFPAPWRVYQIPAPAKPDRGPDKPAELAHLHIDMLYVGTADSSGELVPALREVSRAIWVPVSDLRQMPGVRADVPVLAAGACSLVPKRGGLPPRTESD